MCTACQVRVQNPDAATEAFASDLLDTLNRGALALAISLGHRAGLFDAMGGVASASAQDMERSSEKWATSETIAQAAGRQERYVREWLGAMVTGGIVAYDATHQTYHLPAHHAAVLTRAAGSDNIATAFQWISVLGDVESEVVDCFEKGGGVPYERYRRFHQVMAEESVASVVSGLFDHVLPLAHGVMDRLREGIDVLDIGCGSGRALCALAERYPASRFVGRDLCEAPILAARAEAQRRGIRNVRFETADVTHSIETQAYDLVTGFDVIHDQRDPTGVLRNVYSMLRPGGTFLMQDIKASSNLEDNVDHLLGPFFYTISTMHCMTVSLAQGGEALGTVWGWQLAVKMLEAAGFDDVAVHELEHDIQNNWYVMSKAAA